MNLKVTVERIPIFAPPWWAWDITWRRNGSGEGSEGVSVSTVLLVALAKAWWRSR